MRILIILFLGSTLFSCEDKKTKVNKIDPKKSTSTPITKDVNLEYEHI